MNKWRTFGATRAHLQRLQKDQRHIALNRSNRGSPALVSGAPLITLP